MRFGRTPRVQVVALVLAAGLAVTGCGGGSSHSTNAVTAAASTSTSAAAATRAAATAPARNYSFRNDALVTMRQYSPESLLWQTVSINQGGAAVLTTLIGEQTGATQKQFRLSAHQAATLRRLVANARTVRPPRQSDPHAVLYTLHISGKPAESLQGRTPPQLSDLVVFLSNLMLSECC